MSVKPSKLDEIKFSLQRVSDEDGNECIRVNIPVKRKDFKHNFYVHYRKKGDVQWQSSPLIRQTNFIDIHGLEPNFVYEIRVALLSDPKELSTHSIRNEVITHNIKSIENDLLVSFEKVEFPSIINKEIAIFADKIMNDVFQYLYYSITNVSNTDFRN